ncbi:MAG: hypothetical protein ACYCUI_07795 [Vulcanimicrobiaceae bacterium]
MSGTIAQRLAEAVARNEVFKKERDDDVRSLDALFVDGETERVAATRKQIAAVAARIDETESVIRELGRRLPAEQLANLEAEARERHVELDAAMNEVARLRAAFETAAAAHQQVASAFDRARIESFSATTRASKARERVASFLERHPELAGSVV